MKSYFANSLFFSLFLFSVLILNSCGGINISQKIIPGEGDWNMAAGNPEQQNVSKSVLLPPLNLMWSYNIDGGVGYSGISVADAIVFVNAQPGELFSLDISSGGKIGKLGFLGKEASSTPLIMGNNIIVSYAGDNDYSLASYSIEKGEVNWRINLGYLQTSPILSGGFIYAGSLNGNEYKVNPETDSIYWKFDTKSQIHSTCCITNNKVIFGADNGSIYCLNSSDGSMAWTFKTGASVFATPLAYDNKVYVGSYDSSYYCINIADGSVVWKNNMKTKILGGSTLYNGDIVFGGVDGYLYSLNASDGRLNWKFFTKGVISSSPLTSGKYIYFTSYDFYVYCIDGEKGSMVWNYELEGKSKTSPVIWKDYLFVIGDVDVYCFSDKTPVQNGNK
jgi:outer membrane protein assembly factor BamB